MSTVLSETQTAVTAIDAILLKARDAHRARVADPAVWEAFKTGVRPHLDVLAAYARRGQLDERGTDALRGTLGTLWVFETGATHRANGVANG